MEKERLQKAGDYILDGALIVGSSGARINVTDQVRELNIYENIDTPYITGTLLISDSAGVAGALPFLGQERLLFNLRTPSHTNSVDFNNYHAIIYNVEKRFSTSEREHSLLLNWTTLDHYKNIRTKISASFSGTISEIVEEILTRDDCLGSKKPLYIDPTKNIRKYVIPNLTPFQAINLIKSEAISGEEQAPHYVFFENSRGIHFRSLDSLIGQGGELSVPHKTTYHSQPPEQNNPEANLTTILHWELQDNSNSFLNTRLGMYASTLYYHDIFNKNIQKFEYNYMSDKFLKRNYLEQQSKTSGSLISQTILENEKMISEFPNSKIFVHPTGSNNLHTEGTDNNAEEWLQESYSRELERSYFTLKIETYGDTNIMVGDLIKILIPQNKPLAPPTSGAHLDPLLSGRYLITSLHHQVAPTEQAHHMTLGVSRDSLTMEPDFKETKYAVPPTGSVDKGLKSTKKHLSPKSPHAGSPKLLQPGDWDN